MVSILPNINCVICVMLNTDPNSEKSILIGWDRKFLRVIELRLPYDPVSCQTKWDLQIHKNTKDVLFETMLQRDTFNALL